MQFLGRLLDTVSSVSTLFSNPYRVRDVPQSDYGGGGGKIILKQEGRVVLYKNTQCQSWDCLLLLPETPAMALRLFQVVSEEDAMEWFQQYGLKLKPFYETLPLKVEMVQTIVDCIRSHPDWSSAHIAVETGLRDCLKHNLVQSQINCQDATGQTPLHLACEKSDLASLKALLEESQARTDIKDHNGDTPMHCASKQDSPVFIQALCSQLCSGVNTLNNGGETPLHVACRQGRVESIKALLEGGAKCDVDGNAGYPIHTAVKYSQKGVNANLISIYFLLFLWQMCRLLLNHGSDVNYLSRTGESALHILTERGRFEAAMVLLTHGAHANLKGRDGNTALHLAMKADNIEMIKALIVFGADVEIHNDLGETPGLIAARTSKGPNRKILLDMLRSVGVHRCLPPSPGSPPPLPISNKIKPQGIGNTILLLELCLPVAASFYFFLQTAVLMDRLLCLDGGGIKGLVLIQMLIALEREAGRPIRELFDWIAGTSTGGILALAIIHGKNMEYLRCLYFRMKEQVFKGSRPYESAPLEEFLKTEFGENTKMTDVQYPRVMVTSVLADRHPGELHIFRNYDLPDPREPPYASTATFQPLITPQGWEDEDVLIVGYTEEPPRKRRKVADEEQLVWRAARCSGAAPTYFRPMGRFLDGGLLANNPTLDAITEIHQHNKTLNAKGLQQDVKKLGVVVSLGTGKPPQEVVTSVDVFRPTNPLQLAKTFVGVKELGKMLVDCCTDSDGCTVDRARAWCEMVDTIYHRLSPQLSQEVMLDEVSDTVLVNMLWETQMYLFQKRDILQSLAQLLLQ
uniref:phospholipase A2 n=1 Tax=Nothobranchius furzeri TaxID=105023 RepID=A0A8C6KCE8_NOTFU